MPDSDARRNPRLRLACARCQRRKIRCDGQYPVCSNCRKASAECIDGDSVRLRPGRRDHASDRVVERLKDRITWLEEMVRERLPDVDLSAGPPSGVAEVGNGDTMPRQQEREEERHEEPTSSVTAPNLPAASSDQRAHEIGLISVGANADQKYLGPSSGYFLARLLLVCSPREGAVQTHNLRDATNVEQSTINDLVDALQGPLALPTRSLANRLSQVYFDIVNPQWPILHEPSFRTALGQLFLNEENAPGTCPADPHIHFQVFMVLAISATVLSSWTKRQVPGESYCLSALQYLDQLNIQTSLSGLKCMLLLLIFTLHSPHMRVNVWHLNYQCIATVLDLGLQRNVTASTGISLLNQEMRTRIFWVVFTLDRTIATMMGRPIGLRDEACELRLPQNLDDYDLADTELPPEQRNSMEYSIHLFKLARLNSEIKYVANSIVRDAPAYAYPPVADVAQWQRDMLIQLDQWAASIPRLDHGNKYMETLCEIRYCTIKMLLLRPSPAIPTPSSEMLMLCHRSSRQTIRLYEQLYKQDLLVHDWITLHGIILATITMLYCLRAVRDVARETEPEDLMSDMSVSLSILSATGEYWTGAKRSREVLDDLGRSTLRYLKTVKTTDPQIGDGIRLPVPNGPISTESTDMSILRSNLDPNLLPTFFTPLVPSVDMQMEPSNWHGPGQQQYAFSDIMNVDDIMRNLFDGFIPQLDNYNTVDGFYAA